MSHVARNSQKNINTNDSLLSAPTCVPDTCVLYTYILSYYYPYDLIATFYKMFNRQNGETEKDKGWPQILLYSVANEISDNVWFYIKMTLKSLTYEKVNEPIGMTPRL